MEGGDERNLARTHPGINGEDSRSIAVSMEDAAAITSYPFVASSFCKFQIWNPAAPAPMSFQDMVIHASNGGLDPTIINDVRDVRSDPNGDDVIIISNDSGSCSKQMANGLTRSESTKTREHNYETRSHICVDVDMGNGGISDSANESGAVVSVVDCIEKQSEANLDQFAESQPWPKCKRLPDGAPVERPPRSMGAIELALRNSSTRKTTFIFEPTPGMTFDCVAEAVEFYNIYSWEVGFGTKKGDKYGNSMQELQCQCHGSDNRVQYKTKKKKCPAMVRLHRTQDFGWYVSLHRAEHNHPLAQSYSEKLCWNSHGKIHQSTKDMIRYLRDNNVTLTKVNHIIGSMLGHVGEPPWSSNSISNLVKRIAKEQKADDVRKTLEMFKELKKQDPGFQFSVDYDAKNKIKTLMWCTGRSRSQYACFGDAVTFDTTYCTNIYKMPFGIFVGVNNHFQSIIYAGVLMSDEKTESFEWVFEEFVKLMGGDRPQTILTDQCQAMDIAIANCWPGVAHLWCRWHILKTAQEDIGPLFNFGTPFYNQFHKIINDMLTIDEFEKAWHQLLADFNLKDNKFMECTFNKRFRWAKPYIKGTYCAGMTSTQRSESANNMLKHHVPRHSSMNKFVQNYNNLLTSRYKVEQEAEHETKQNVFVHDRAWPMEIHALQVYTNAAFKLFQKQVDISTRYNVRITTDPSVFLVVHDKAKRKEQYARVEFTVKVEDGADFFECDCGMYSHIGILCCHSIRVMLQLGISRIPDRHIMNRWTRVAREMVPDDINFYPAASASMQQPLTYRHRLLSADAARMITEGDYDAETFEIATKHMNRAFMEIEEYKKIKNFEDHSYHTQTDASCSDACYGSETDGETNGNRYGAAGSSAGLSDSELLSLRPPEVKVRRGRPRINRFRGRLEIIKEKMMNKSEKKKLMMKKKKAKKACLNCGLDDHKSSECFTKSVGA